ncbi:MAG: hypothetical protein OEO23_02405 [Gemmatimonadota bacterium]|nr:hypothetical protein [Gemmatimonadota bacterium]
MSAEAYPAVPRPLGAWFLGILIVLAIVAFSRVSWAPDEAVTGVAQLRLSWRFQAPTVQQCRPPRPEELTGVPTHMRPTQICEGGPVPFQLTVSLDDVELVSGPVAFTGERALSVYETFPVEPGEHRLSVAFIPVPFEMDESGEDPPAWRLDRTVSFEEGRIRLVTLGADGLSVVEGG